jgi:hypothetical protein
MRMATLALACLGSGCLDQSADLVPIPHAGVDAGAHVRPPNTGPGCALGFTPPALDFGNVLLGSTLTDQVEVFNDGGGICAIAGLSLGTGTDPDYSLPQQPTSFLLAPQASASVSVTFSAADDDLPHLRTGTLTLQSNDDNNPNPTIPLSAYINDNCSAASQLIYLVDAAGHLSSFDPSRLVFNDIGPLNCPFASGPMSPGGGSPTPFSMNVDQNAVAWVLYSDGELFRVDTSTASCTATSFQPNQQNFQLFGMGSVFNASTGVDTLYIAGGPDYFSGNPLNVQLGTIAFPSLAVSTVGPLAMGWAELAGTGDGQLWGFVPAGRLSTAGFATLAQIDPTSGDSIRSYQLQGMISNASGGFAMKFYGGSFWVFLGNKVYQVRRSDGAVVATLDTGRSVVGAGVSTCAPVQ